MLHFAEVISATRAKLGTNGQGLGQSDQTSQEAFAVLREYKQSSDMTGEQKLLSGAQPRASRSS